MEGVGPGVGGSADLTCAACGAGKYALATAAACTPCPPYPQCVTCDVGVRPGPGRAGLWGLRGGIRAGGNGGAVSEVPRGVLAEGKLIHI